MTIDYETEYPSLSPSALQLRWKIPTEFPECPSAVSDGALEEYAARLEFGTLFSQNTYTSSWVVDRQLTADGVVVLTHFGEQAIKNWAVAYIFIYGDLFYHRNETTFYTLRGALKHFCSLADERLDDSIDDYC